MDAVTAHTMRSHPATSDLVERLRQAFGLLFEKSQIDGVDEAMARSKSEIALIKIEGANPSQSMFREIEHLLRVGVVDLNLQVSKTYCYE